MVSLSVVKDAGYFHSSVEHAVEYYARRGSEVEGWWQGRFAEELGLKGREVRQEDVEGVAGFIRNGERLGVDVTYSAPKSVSLIYSLLGDERVKEAHERAVRVANEWLEENLVWTRQGHGGKERVPASGVAIVNYTHYTSRAHDPNLHTHSVVLNAVIRKTDGEIRALEPLQIFEYQRVVDQIYKNELARALQELGYSIEMKDGNGNFEIRGISKDVIDKFSERRNQIERAFAELKERIEIRNEGAIKDMLAVKTREGKEVLSREELERLWDEKLRELGISREELRRAVEKAKEEVVEVSKRDVKEFVREAANILHENESAFTKERLIEVALRLSLSQAGNGLQVVRVEDIERAIKDLRKEGYLVELNGYLATKEMVRVEREVIEYVQRTNGTVKEIEGDRVKIEEAIKRFEERVGYQLTEDQRKAAFHVLQSRDRVVGIQGDAGTGKTTVFQFLSGELGKRGFEMRGMAPTGKAADVLSREAGVRAQTVDSFLIEFERMKVVDNKAEYIRRYNEIKRKFEERSWWTPPRFLSGGIWDKIFGKKRETLASQVKNWLRKELGIGKKGERLNWFERKVSERCYVIEGNGFKGKMIVETVRTALGHYETYVYVKNEKTGDITVSRYASLPTGTAVPISRKEKEEVWVNPERIIEKGKEVWVIDESSMLDSKKMGAILEAAEKAGARVIVVGDTKQLKAVGAGQIFKDMQLNGMNTVVMSQKVRQKVEEYKQAVDALGKQDW
jgi:conjugative relaxase-like TrwC/TraI family protein